MAHQTSTDAAKSDLQDRVIDIVSRWSRLRRVELNSELWTDCKIAGDDVDELFEELLKQFGPLPLADIQWHRHFEMNEPPFHFDLFRRRRKRFERERVPVRVHHLVTWIETKSWPIDYQIERPSSEAK